MSFNDDYLKLRKKRLEEQKQARSFEFVSGPYQNATLMADDIAPVATNTIVIDDVDDVGNKNAGKESGLFKAGAFADGYQVGDVAKTILGTAGDIASGLVQGVVGMGEGLGDLISYGIAGVQDLVGKDDDAERLRKEAAKSQLGPLFDSFRESTNIDDNSLLGDFGYGIAQGVGQVGAIIATGGMGQAAGLGSVGTSALTTGMIGASSMGSGMSEAYQGGATDKEALTYGVSKGLIDAGTEMIFAGLGKSVKAIGVSKGLTSLDDVFAKKLSSKMSNQFFKNATQYGVKATAEGFEEVLAGYGSAVAKKLTYMSDEELSHLVEDENLLEQFVAGALVSGIAQSGDLVKSTKQGRDFITNFSTNEETVIEKVYNDRVAEAEQDGTKLTKKEKNEIYEQVQADMRKGYISTDTIESVLGGETYKSYKDTVDSEDAILKEFDELGKKQNATLADQARYAELQAQVKEIKSNSNRNNLKSKLSEEVYNSVKKKDFYLAESYNERARQGTAFEADLSQYDDKTAETVKRAIDSGILNNTRRTHEFVDMLAKISADKGVLFDFTNNKKLKESGFAVNGASVNGYVTKDGITVNISSSKAHNSIVGHEITHVLEGTALYAEMQTAIFEYAKSKKDYDGRRKVLEELYKNVKDADIDAELTADLVGDYLFTDEAFINNLSTKHRNVFQKIYDEVKYLLKVATKGSKEARQLEKVKRAFEKAYRVNGKAQKNTADESGTKYSIVQLEDGKVYVEASRNIINGNTRAEQRREITDFFSKLLEDNPSLDIHTIEGDVLTITKAETAHKARDDYKTVNGQKIKMSDNEFVVKLHVESHIDEVAEVSTKIGKEADTKNHSFAKDGFSYRRAYFKDFDGQYYEVTLSIGNNGTVAKVYNVGKTKESVAPSAKIIAAVGSKSLGETLSNNNIPQKETNVKRKLSLSADSDGKKLTKEQSEYFKDSKMRDENGNLKVMYHGSQDAGFHTFDANMSDDDTSFFFVDRNDVAASYSGTSETYEAQTIRTAEDMNNFIESIGVEGYEVVEKDGKFTLLYEGDRVADSNTAKGIYEEFCWYEGVGEGDANYKVYLNLKNPLEVDAEGRNWNNISREFSQEVYGRYKSLTAEEKAALSNLAEWGEYSIFKDEMLDARAAAEQGVSSGYGDVAFTKTLARSYAKLGGANANLYDAFSIAQENFSEESLREFAVKQMNTRDYARKAKAEGYDGVIFKNIHDNGGYSNGSEGASTVAIAFESNQIKSVANEKPTGNADIRYSLSSDSEGRELSAEQREYFKDSKIVDDNGKLKVMHHGSPETFTVFDKKKARSSGTYGKGFYFTDSTSHAATYGKAYDVYLNITNPLQNGTNDITKDQIRKFVEAIAEDEDYGIDNYGYDATIDSVTNSVYGKSDFGMIMDLNISCVGNMVEAIELFNKVNGTNYNGIVAPTETIAFYPEQIKNIDNKAPTSNPDIRFSLSEAVEETKDLIAVHNLSEEKLTKSLALGGLPMPSIAIARAKDGHSNFGNISLVFNKETIDPQFMRSNKVYSGDAWTPTYPRVEYKLNDKALKQIRDKISSLVSYDVLTDVGNAHLDSDNMTDTLNRFGGNVAEAFKYDDGLKYAYLKDMGANITLPMKEKNLSYYGYRENGAIIRVAEALSAEELQQALNSGAEAAEKIEPIVRSAVAEYMQEKYGNDPDLLDLMMPKEKLTFSDLNGYIMEARNYHRNGVQQTVDTKAARELIREQVNQAEYENWLKNLFSNIVEKEGIRNEKDLFTPSGNRRSFEALHYEHNLENVIRAMKEKGDKGIGAWGGGNIFGAATTEYGSISEIKAEAQNRMKLMSESEYEEIRKGFSDRFFELAHSLPIHKDSYVATDDAANMLIEAVAKYKTKSGMANYLRNESKGWANYSNYVVDDLIQLVSEIRSMPVGYFEAKPQRAVGFNEVAAAIIPDSTNAELKQILTDKGIPFIEYESGNEQARLEALNSLEEAKFSLSKKGETPKRYGNYNIFGEDIKLEAPTQKDVAPESEVVAKNAIPTENVAPMPSEPTIYELEQKQTELEDTIRKAMENNDPNAPKLIEEYTALLDRVNKLKAEEYAMESERLASLDDADIPPEIEAPYYGESEDVAPSDPFEERDIKAVGNRKVKAYMYENPEVKSFFQEEANIMLGELRDATKGEKLYTEVEGGVPGAYGSDSYGVWSGTKRHVSADIAYLLDNLNFSYADIEKGLNAIIEDHGAENNAASKRIEFILNDRLLKGYTEFTNGYDVPPNQDYINLLNEKQIIEYSDEARAKFFEVADEYAPPMDDIAPIAPIAESKQSAKAYEAIKPKKETAEPKMKRVKEGEQSPGGKERKWVGTSTESEAVDGKILPDDLDQEAIHYQPISNKKTLGNANTKLNGMGYEASVAYFNSQFANKKTTLDDIVLGERLIQEAIKRGDTKTAGELIEDVAILGTELGQKVQALSIIKRLTPEGQLRMLQRTVERGKTRGDKAFEGVEITQEMIDKILATYGKDGSFDQTKLNEAVEDAKQKIADQMKVTKMDKVNAWRYLSMLGNPKTHIRNLVSNVAMSGTTAVKNVVARTIETFAPIENRTKTWKTASEEVKTFAQKTAVEMKDELSDGGKYNEDASIKQKRAIFKNKVLNGVYEFNSDMLSKEDWWFSKPAFINALSEYLTANGISTAQDIQNNPKIVAKAKQYATEQSQIATFRQYSWLANKINEIEHKNVATEIAIGAVLPFKKTPINIAKTALNYSPLGFAKTLTYDATQVKNGKMEASEMIDHLAQNVTGSALVLIGYMLANAGFLNGAGEDDKEGDYDYQLGEQAYSVNIGDATFSLSWLSPIAMPLFVGANAYEQLEEGKEWNGDVVVETLAQTLDPLSEMSFLSSLDSVLASYDSGLEKFAGIAQSAAQSYTTQFVPTLSSQVAAVMDDTKRSTKVAADSDFKFVDETVNKLKYKIPFLRETLEPSTDIWGNDVKQTENIMERALETFIAPYAKKEDISSGVDEELKALYKETGDAGLIPSIPYNYINYNGEKYEMSASEYTEYKELYGQNAYELMSDLFKTSTYKAASSEERADMVNRVYDFARDEAKREYFAKYGVEFTNATKDGEEYYKENSIKGAIEYDMTPDEYEFVIENPEKYKFFNDVGVTYEEYANGSEDFKDAYSWAFKNPEKFTVSKAVASDVVTYRKYASDLYDIKADKDEYGKSISGSRKEKVIEYVNNLDIDYGARLILFKSEYNADDTYNYDIIDYLNNRQDISYEEMETILKELGFTILSDGTIQWD